MRIAMLVCMMVLGCSSKSERQEPLLAAAKECAKGGELECPRPIFRVSDPHGAQRYYVDRLYKEFTERHAIIQMPPTNMPWGLREMQVADRDGNVLRFASPIEHH